MARRNTQTFSLSFLDVISCGFGAVVLFYTIISAQSGLFKIKESEDLAAEARRIEQQVLEGYKHLAELKNALDATAGWYCHNVVWVLTWNSPPAGTCAASHEGDEATIRSASVSLFFMQPPENGAEQPTPRTAGYATEPNRR